MGNMFLVAGLLDAFAVVGLVCGLILFFASNPFLKVIIQYATQVAS